MPSNLTRAQTGAVSLGSVEEAERAAEQAATDAAESRAAHEASLAQLRAGDTSISAADLDEQERLARFAELRAEGANARLARARQAAAINAARQAVAQIVAECPTAADPATVLEAFTDAAIALRRLRDVAQVREETIQRHMLLIDETEQELTRTGAGSGLAEFGLQRGHAGYLNGYRVPEAGIALAPIEAGRLIGLAVETISQHNSDLGTIRGWVSAADVPGQLALYGMEERLPGIEAAADRLRDPASPVPTWRQPEKVEAS